LIILNWTCIQDLNYNLEMPIDWFIEPNEFIKRLKDSLLNIAKAIDRIIEA